MTQLRSEDRTPGRERASPETLALARTKVRDLLTRSAAFNALPPETRKEIARNTVQVATYLADPRAEGAAGTRATRAATRRNQTQGGSDDAPAFEAMASREGAYVAGALLEQVAFPDFVAGLINGVFHSIVTSSIEQMEAYGELVANVSKSLNEFRDENTSANQGRDHLVEQFPDLFEISMDTGDFGFGDGSAGPRVRLRSGADESTALQRVASLPVEGGPLTSLDDDIIEERLVPAARTQLATSRHQLLATMVLMGINRIVVTDGKISAKVMYDFRARDNMRYQRSATRFDYGSGSVVTETGDSEIDAQRDSVTRTKQTDGSEQVERRGGTFYSKGSYKRTTQPVLTLASATQTTGEASIETKAQLAGVVDINFKSDYLPLERMADSFQIAQIQSAARPASTEPSTPRPLAAPAPSGPVGAATPSAPQGGGSSTQPSQPTSPGAARQGATT